MSSTEKNLVDSIRSFFSSRNWDPGEGIVVAFSGGADSSALLYLLSRFIPTSSLSAVYVNHRLRPDDELEKEITVNKTFCCHLGVEFIAIDCGKGIIADRAVRDREGIEAAARAVRYEILEKERARRGFSWTATGHTADDQMETVLHRLFRGCSVAALRGIEAVNGNIIRPLLEVSGDTLRSLLEAQGLPWSEDSTNASDDYTRNRIRHEIVPVVLDIFPAARGTLTAFSRRAGDAALILETAHEAVEPRIEEAVELKTDGLSVPLDILLSLPRHTRGEVLFHLWDKLHRQAGETARPLGFAALERLQTMLEKQTGRISAWGTEASVADRSFRWHFSDEGSVGWCIPLHDGEGDISLPDEVLLLKRKSSVDTKPSIAPGQNLEICNEALVPPVMLRTWEGGDRILLMEGTKTVSDMLSSWKIPMDLRQRVCLLQDANGIQAVFAHAWGGRDRMSVTLKSPHLVGKKLTLYSVEKRNDCCGK